MPNWGRAALALWVVLEWIVSLAICILTSIFLSPSHEPDDSTDVNQVSITFMSVSVVMVCLDLVTQWIGQAGTKASVGFCIFNGFECVVSVAIMITTSVLYTQQPAFDKSDIDQYSIALLVVSWLMWVMDTVTAAINLCGI
jgi:hypothetical protein